MYSIVLHLLYVPRQDRFKYLLLGYKLDSGTPCPPPYMTSFYNQVIYILTNIMNEKVTLSICKSPFQDWTVELI